MESFLWAKLLPYPHTKTLQPLHSLSRVASSTVVPGNYVAFEACSPFGGRPRSRRHRTINQSPEWPGHPQRRRAASSAGRPARFVRAWCQGNRALSVIHHRRGSCGSRRETTPDAARCHEVQRNGIKHARCHELPLDFERCCDMFWDSAGR